MPITVQEILDRSREISQISETSWKVDIDLREIETERIYNIEELHEIFEEGEYKGFVKIRGKDFLASIRNFEFIN